VDKEEDRPRLADFAVPEEQPSVFYVNEVFMDKGFLFSPALSFSREFILFFLSRLPALRRQQMAIREEGFSDATYKGNIARTFAPSHAILIPPLGAATVNVFFVRSGQKTKPHVPCTRKWGLQTIFMLGLRVSHLLDLRRV
jgi:hypothetical protein